MTREELIERCAAYEPRQEHWRQMSQKLSRHINANEPEIARLKEKVEQLQNLERRQAELIKERVHADRMAELCTQVLTRCRRDLVDLEDPSNLML